MPAEPEKNRDQAYRVDRDKKRDEGEQKFFQIGMHADGDLGAATFAKQVTPSSVAASLCEA